MRERDGQRTSLVHFPPWWLMAMEKQTEADHPACSKLSESPPRPIVEVGTNPRSHQCQGHDLILGRRPTIIGAKSP